MRQWTLQCNAGEGGGGAAAWSGSLWLDALCGRVYHITVGEQPPSFRAHSGQNAAWSGRTVAWSNRGRAHSVQNVPWSGRAKIGRLGGHGSFQPK